MHEFLFSRIYGPDHDLCIRSLSALMYLSSSSLYITSKNKYLCFEQQLFQLYICFKCLVPHYGIQCVQLLQFSVSPPHLINTPYTRCQLWYHLWGIPPSCKLQEVACVLKRPGTYLEVRGVSRLFLPMGHISTTNTCFKVESQLISIEIDPNNNWF